MDGAKTPLNEALLKSWTTLVGLHFKSPDRVWAEQNQIVGRQVVDNLLTPLEEAINKPKQRSEHLRKLQMAAQAYNVTLPTLRQGVIVEEIGRIIGAIYGIDSKSVPSEALMRQVDTNTLYLIGKLKEEMKHIFSLR